MNLKYWEWETGAFKERVKKPGIREIARVLFENETQAYRFASALLEVKKRGRLRLRDCPESLPIATWKRYLDYAVQIGMLKHEEESYEFTDRFTAPVKNFAAYVQEWVSKGDGNEDLESAFAFARKEKQKKRGGKAVKA